MMMIMIVMMVTVFVVMIMMVMVVMMTIDNPGEWSAPIPACKQVPCPPIISLVTLVIIIINITLIIIIDIIHIIIKTITIDHHSQVRDPLVRVIETHHGKQEWTQSLWW